MARPEGLEPPTLCLEVRFKSILKSVKTSGFHRICFESFAAPRGTQWNPLERECFLYLQNHLQSSEVNPSPETMFLSTLRNENLLFTKGVALTWLLSSRLRSNACITSGWPTNRESTARQVHSLPSGLEIQRLGARRSVLGHRTKGLSIEALQIIERTTS